MVAIKRTTAEAHRLIADLCHFIQPRLTGSHLLITVQLELWNLHLPHKQQSFLSLFRQVHSYVLLITTVDAAILQLCPRLILLFPWICCWSPSFPHYTR